LSIFIIEPFNKNLLNQESAVKKNEIRKIQRTTFQQILNGITFSNFLQ